LFGDIVARETNKTTNSAVRSCSWFASKYSSSAAVLDSKVSFSHVGMLL